MIPIVIQIRDFEYNSETQEGRKQELEKLMQDQESLKSSLLQWCYTSYGEVSIPFYEFLEFTFLISISMVLC